MKTSEWLTSDYKVTEFNTAHEFTYRCNENGTFTRIKQWVRLVGFVDMVQTKTAPMSYCVTIEGCHKLRGPMFQYYEDGTKTALRQYKDGRIGVQFIDGPNEGKWDEDSLVSTVFKPDVGNILIETWQDGSIAHFGNKIIKIKKLWINPRFLYRNKEKARPTPSMTTDDIRNMLFAQFLATQPLTAMARNALLHSIGKDKIETFTVDDFINRGIYRVYGFGLKSIKEMKDLLINTHGIPAYRLSGRKWTYHSS